MNLVARLEGPIHRLDSDRDRALGDAERLLNEASTLETRIGETFPHRDRLADLRHRHQKILDELAAQADQSSDDASTPAVIDPRARLDDLKTRHESPWPAAPGL